MRVALLARLPCSSPPPLAPRPSTPNGGDVRSLHFAGRGHFVTTQGSTASIRLLACHPFPGASADSPLVPEPRPAPLGLAVLRVVALVATAPRALRAVRRA